MRISLIALLVTPSLALAQGDARTVAARDGFASPVLVVSPKMPARSATDPASVEVRVSGTISASGLLEDARFEDGAGKEKYVAAVRDVLPLWRFKPAVDLDACTPRRQAGTVSVWFEDKGGKPAVSVSMPRSGGAADAPKAGGEGAIVKVTHRPRADFPIEARDIGADGAAEVLVKLDAAGHNVRQTLLYSTPHSMFGTSAMASARDVQVALGGAKAQCVAVAYHFCIDKDVAYPNSACEVRRARNEL